jgi:hypothetical protein
MAYSGWYATKEVSIGNVNAEFKAIRECGQKWTTQGFIKMKTINKINAPGMTRTCGAWIRNPLLYPPELRGQGY